MQDKKYEVMSMNIGDHRPCTHCEEGIQKLRNFDLFYWIWVCRKCGGENFELKKDRPGV
jgi:Zn finger protein HypA/HybF involved in hydrogenase expression